MKRPATAAVPDSPLDAAVECYLLQWDEGLNPDPAAVARQFSVGEAELLQFLDHDQQLHFRLQSVLPAAEAKSLRIRCPHCHTLNLTALDTDFESITCQSCHQAFHFVDQPGPTTPPLPPKLRRFELQSWLGMGTFGQVWKAHDTLLDRVVALKLPRARGSSNEEEEQFLREARAAARLRHPNIVHVHEVGREDDQIYIVSDYVEGSTLAEWLVDQSLTGREAAELCRKLAAALHHAHQQGVVHRDLKPANIMVDASLEPYILDFGLARRETGDVTVTLDGKILGTPAYMSPEQAQGQSHTAGKASDIYSLGVILFELLTGELPFRGSAATLLHQVISAEPPSPRTLNSTIQRDLETITLKCLEKDPARRYASAIELSDELDRVLRGEPILARPVSRLEHAWRWMKRKPAIAASLLVAIVSLIAVVAVLATSNARIRQEMASKDRAIQQRDTALTTATQNAELERRRYYSAQIALAAQARKDRDTPRVVTLLEPLRPKKGEQDFRGFEWRHLYHVCHANVVRRWKAHDAGDSINALVWPPNANWFASSLSYGGVAIWNGTTGESEFVLSVPLQHDIWQLAASDDGRWLIAALNSGEVVVWDIGERKLYSRWMAHPKGESGIRTVGISPDGRRIVTGTRGTIGKTIHQPGKALWDLEGKRLSTFGDDPQWVGRVAYSPDGKMLATAGFDYEHQENRRIRFWDMDSDTPRLLGETTEGGAMDVAFSPDGKQLWGTCMGPTSEPSTVLRIFDTTKLMFQGVVKDNQGASRAFAAVPSQNKFVMGTMDRRVYLWDAATREAKFVGAELGSVYSIAGSADGTRIVCGDAEGYLTLRDLKRPPAVRRIDTSDGESPLSDIWYATFSSDGSKLYLGGPSLVVVDLMSEAIEDLGWQNILGFSGNGAFAASHRWQVGELDIREVATGKVLGTFTTGPDITHAIVSNDGRYAASHRHQEHDKIQLHDLHTGQTHAFSSGFNHWLRSAAFSPKSNALAIGAQWHALSIWHPETQELLFSERAPISNRLVADEQQYSLDAKLLATGFDNGTILIWDVDEHGACKLRGQLDGHALKVWDLSFTPDGERLASSSGDGTVRVWDIESMQEMMTLQHGAKRLEFSPAGDKLLLIDFDNSVRILETTRL